MTASVLSSMASSEMPLACDLEAMGGGLNRDLLSMYVSTLKPWASVHCRGTAAQRRDTGPS